ncbi:hypothetical protein [Streptomyces aurantiacus]|uniref:hypothetical protein n=1 Tax=Streptomyces aurantiacus TaxID=47760 RepID=UPI0027D867B3|nr:hypothetical protein [Streptomyces aurantiacus]
MTVTAPTAKGWSGPSVSEGRFGCGDLVLELLQVICAGLGVFDGTAFFSPLLLANGLQPGHGVTACAGPGQADEHLQQTDDGPVLGGLSEQNFSVAISANESVAEQRPVGDGGLSALWQTGFRSRCGAGDHLDRGTGAAAGMRERAPW